MGGQPLRDIAGRFGTSRSALLRHRKADIPATLAKAKQAADDVQGETLFEQVKGLAAEAKAILEEARASNNHSVALQAIGRAEKLLELEARLLGELNQDTRVAVGIKVNPVDHLQFGHLYHMSKEQLAARCEEMARKFRRLDGHL